MLPLLSIGDCCCMLLFLRISKPKMSVFTWAEDVRMISVDASCTTSDRAAESSLCFTSCSDSFSHLFAAGEASSWEQVWFRTGENPCFQMVEVMKCDHKVAVAAPTGLTRHSLSNHQSCHCPKTVLLTFWREAAEWCTFLQGPGGHVDHSELDKNMLTLRLDVASSLHLIHTLYGVMC